MPPMTHGTGLKAPAFQHIDLPDYFSHACSAELVLLPRPQLKEGEPQEYTVHEKFIAEFTHE